MTIRKRYDDQTRSTAVLFLEAAGYPERKGALMEVARNMGIPAMTISRWFRATQNPPPHYLVNVKRGEIVDRLEEEIHAILDDLPSARPDADFRDLATSMAILIDKVQLLRNKPTSIEWRKELSEHGIDPEYLKSKLVDEFLQAMKPDDT